METDAPQQDHRKKLADSILDVGKKAFDPLSDPASKEAAQREFQQLIDGYVIRTGVLHRRGF